MIGGIAKNHDSNSCGHHTGNDDPESAAIVTFALSLPLSNEESGSSNDIALDMFLLVKVSIHNLLHLYYGCRVRKRAK